MQIVKFPSVSGSYLKMVIFDRNIFGLNGNQHKKIIWIRSDGDFIYIVYRKMNPTVILLSGRARKTRVRIVGLMPRFLPHVIVKRGSNRRRNAIASIIYDLQLSWHVSKSWIHISRQNSHWKRIFSRSRGESDTMGLGSIPWRVLVVLSVKNGRNQNKRTAQLGSA
jgi:hypothetical protein